MSHRNRMPGLRTQGPAFGIVVLLTGLTGIASAQYGGPCPTPCPPQPICQPVQQVCAAPQPVLQTCYQTVPVTEYKKAEVTVQKPVWDVEYVERPVTKYRPVTEQRTVNVPTVSYRNVTQYRTVTENRGHWQTYYKPNPRCSPCEYDNRPGAAGWFNRTAYSMRSSFQPQYTACRRYVPRTCTRIVPETRQVAVRGYRQVTQNVTKMVAYKDTERVAVRKLRYESEKVVAMKPVTTYRTVPTGTAVAYMGGGTSTAYYGTGTTTAYWPGADGYSTAYWYPLDSESATSRTAAGDRYDRTAKGPEPDPISKKKRTRTATAPKDEFEESEPFRRDEASIERESTPERSDDEFASNDVDLVALRARRAARREALAKASGVTAPVTIASSDTAAASTPSVVPTSRRRSVPGLLAASSYTPSTSPALKTSVARNPSPGTPTLVRNTPSVVRTRRRATSTGPILNSPSLAQLDSSL